MEIERAYREQGVFAFLAKLAFDRRTFLQTEKEARAATRAAAAAKAAGLNPPPEPL